MGVDPRNYQRVQDFGNNPHLPGERDTNLTVPTATSGQRDFLVATATPEYTNLSRLEALMAEQNDYLQDIAQYLRRQNADVLCQARVQGTDQSTNAISNTNSTRVYFEVAGKPVVIYSLLAWSTWTPGTIGLSIQGLGSSVNDGIPYANGDLTQFNLPLKEIYLKVPDATINLPCAINGPSNVDIGGFFVYGFTIPDWDNLRGAVRSMGGA